MNSTSKVFGILSVAIVGLIFSCQLAYAATLAGHVQFTYGDVQVTPLEGAPHPLKKGDAINEGDTVITSLSASAQIKMNDGGFIAVRPNTNLKFDKFVFHGKPDGEERSFFSLVKGGFRAITGLIGKENKQNYSIKTVTATIGIRGTDHETFFVPEGTALIPAGAYSKVNVGETTVTTNRGTVNVMPNQMGYAGNINETPKIVPINTNLYTVAAAPTKTIKQGKAEQASQGDKSAAGGQTGGAQSASSSSTGNASENTTASAGTGSATNSAASDPNTLRTDVTDSGAMSATNVTATSPTLSAATTAQLKVAVPQVIVPIVMTNAGTVLDATTQTTTQGGVTTTLSGSTAPFVAYAYNDVVVLSNNYGIGSLVSPTNLTYVTGAGGGSASSGALSSYTEQSIGGGSNYSNSYTINGGTASSFNAPSFGLTGIQYGSWTGYTSQTYNYSYALGGNNNGSQNSWMYGPQGYLDNANGSTVIGGMSAAGAGTFTYHLDGNNAPRNSYNGTTGTLTSASLTANFNTMLVTANLGLTMPGSDTWAASYSSSIVSLTNGGQFGGSPTVTRGTGTPGTCSTCSGYLSGMFTGQNFSGAILGYSLSDTATATYIYGDAALTRLYPGNSNPSPTTGGNAVTPTNIVIDNGFGYVYSTPLSSVTINSANVLTQYSGVTVTCPTCTAIPSGQVSTSGIYYGTWTSGTWTSTSTNTTSTTPAYWITGPEAGPLYMPQALTGTANYVLDAGQVTNSSGVAGTVNASTALTVNFTNQTVGVNLNATVSGHTWNASSAANGTPLTGNQGIGGGAFYASGLSVTIDGTASTVAYGYVNGQLTGSGLTGAIINFTLSGSNASSSYTDYLSGVAAFTGTAQNINTPYRSVLVSTYDSTSITPTLGFYFNNASRVSQDSSGNLTQFDISYMNNTSGTSSSSSSPACSASGSCTSSGTTSSNNLTVTTSGSTLTDHGTDPVSGISWGRWTGGTLNTTDRATGTVTSTPLTGSLHWIAEPTSTTPVTLPITGTYSYTLAGGTHPTDNLGNVGTLNSASVTANFTAQTVGLGVNASVNGATLNATAPSAPIIQSTVFYASSQEPSTSTSYLTVSCTGTCAATGGTVIGKFTGAGATGIAMSYGLQNGASVINGVAAFHR